MQVTKERNSLGLVINLSCKKGIDVSLVPFNIMFLAAEAAEGD